MEEERLRIDGERVLSRVVDGELVLLDMQTQNYIGGNRAAAAAWPLLERGVTRGELAEYLAGEFGIDPARADAEIGDFIDGLRDRRMIVPDPVGADDD